MMKKTITLILCTLLLEAVNAQVPADEIKGFKKFCAKTTRCRPCDSTFRLPVICNSTMAIEIRLSSVDRQAQLAEEIALCCDSAGKWTAIKGSYRFTDRVNNDQSVELRIFDTAVYQYIEPLVPLDTMYALLKRNDLLTLESTTATSKLDTIKGLSFHQVSIKIGNRFRAFRFGDADELKERFPDEEYFKKCSTIFHLMSTL